MAFSLFPETLETVTSPFNGKITVKKYRGGQIAMMASGSEQSGPYFDSLWSTIFQHLVDKRTFGDPKDVLILGCGGGTQPALLRGKFRGTGRRKITVIEIDNQIVRLAKKYFGLQENVDQTILIADAFKKVKGLIREKKKFDLIIVDIFLGEEVPENVASRSFLESLSKVVRPTGLVIFNFSPKEKNDNQLQDFEKKLRQFFLIQDELLPVKLNQIIICRPIKKSFPEKNYRQSNSYERFISSFGWTVKKVDGVTVLLRRLPFFTFLSLIKVARPNRLLPLAKIDQIAKENHALMIKFDPGDGPLSVDDLRRHGYKKDPWSLLATATVILDLKKPVSEIFATLSPQARRKIRKIESENEKDLAFQHFSSTDKTFEVAMTKFVSGWDKFSTRRKIYSSRDAHMVDLTSAFGKEIELFLIHHKRTKELLWGLLVLRQSKTAYYLHTFTSLSGRDFNTSYWGVWKALPILKKLGAEKLDFEGIFDPRFPKSRRDWVGLTQFKLDWGKPTFFPGSYVKFFNPLIKFLFTIFSNA